MTSLLSTVRHDDGLRPITDNHLLRPSWTVTIIKDMVVMDAPNVKDCVILGLGSALLFFSHHQEPQEGLYLHEAQELAEIMMKTTTWMGQPAHQQVFPIMIAGRQTSDLHVSHCEQALRIFTEFPMETLQAIEREAQIMSSWTDEDEDGGTRPLIPLHDVHSWEGEDAARGKHRVWMPLPHFPGLSHTLNPIQYPPQLNFPPPPLMTPILIGIPPPPYSLPPPPIAAPLAPGLPPVAQASWPTSASQHG